MRFLLHVSIPVESFNQALRDGSVGQKMKRILEVVKPEAAYFTAKDGKRGGFLVINMENVSEMPKFAEPWFLNFNASVEFLPAMTPQDIEKANLEGIANMWK